MKISIQHDDITSCIEFEESSLNEFTEHLRNLLHTIWLPSQVDQIVPREEDIGRELEEVRKEAYEEGLAEGEVNNAKSTQVIFDEGYAKGHDEGYKEGLAFRGEPEHRDEGYEAGVNEMREIYGPMLEKTAKDSERLDWLMNRAYAVQLQGGDILTSRADIDKAMEESQ